LTIDNRVIIKEVIMKKIITILLVLHASLLTLHVAKAQIIHVPGDYQTIQQGIDAASNGDTVLVQPGTYIEQIDFNSKNITVGSLYLTTLDTGYIAQTIIDCNGIRGSVVNITGGQDSTAVLCGLTITGGQTYMGGGIFCEDSGPRLRNLVITGNSAWFGGGIALDNSSMMIQDVDICNNRALNDGWDGSTNPQAAGAGIYCTHSNPVIINTNISRNRVFSLRHGGCFGGGIYFLDVNAILTNVKITYNLVDPWGWYSIGGGICGGDTLNLSNVTIRGNSAEKGGGIAWANIVFDSVNRCSIYLNHANEGNDLFTSSSSIHEIVLDTFTVATPTEFFATPIEEFNFDILHGYTEILETDSDLFVSPGGDNSNNGLTEDEPLKNIWQALINIQADSLHPHTIYLLEGTYSQSVNGEMFPMYLTDYITLSGVSPTGIILDAEESSPMMVVKNRAGVRFRNLTFTGGLGEDWSSLLCIYSDMLLENLRFLTNSTIFEGGVVNLKKSSSVISNCLIAGHQSFGVSLSESDPLLVNVTISNNEGIYGGGSIFCGGSSHPSIVNSILWNDSVEEIVFSSWPWDTSEVTIQHTDIQGGQEGIVGWNGVVHWLEGNIDLEPLFAASGDDLFTLAMDSPCIDAGSADTAGLNLPTFDLLGNQRIWDGDGNGSAIVDMGAYEYGSIPVGIPGFQIPSARWRTKFQIDFFPNPADGIVDCQFGIACPDEGGVDFQRVTLKIYDLFGREVRTLIDEKKSPGEYSVRMNVSALPTGVYLVRLQAGGQSYVRKLVVQ
jgi:hypothetical protein